MTDYIANITDNEDNRECVICYEPLSKTKNMCITECGHEFCFSCMMKHVQLNNGCPCCRTQIIKDMDNDSYSGADYDEEDDQTIEDDENYNDDSDDEYPIENLVDAFAAKGYGLKDALSLLMYNFSKTDPKYTKEYIKQLKQDIDDLNYDLRKEFNEQVSMQANDYNTTAL